jgi:hypothetical protein
MRSRDGRDQPVIFSATFLQSVGQLDECRDQFVGAVMDITERRYAEDALRSTQADQRGHRGRRYRQIKTDEVFSTHKGCRTALPLISASAPS